MQYSFVAAALVATVAAVPSYAPPAYEAPVAPVYPVSTKEAEVPVYSTHEAAKPTTYYAPPVYSTAPVNNTTVVPVYTKTEAVYHPSVYPSQSTDVVSKVTKVYCPSKAYETVVITKTLTSTVDNKPTPYTTVVTETKAVVTKPAATTVPVYPVQPTAPVYNSEQPKPSAPVYTTPATPSSPAQPPKYETPAVYKPAGNATTPKSPVTPEVYTGAASSLTVAGLFAGFGAVAAFFL